MGQYPSMYLYILCLNLVLYTCIVSANSHKSLLKAYSLPFIKRPFPNITSMSIFFICVNKNMLYDIKVMDS